MHRRHCAHRVSRAFSARAVGVALAFVLAPLALHAQGRAFTPADWYRVTTVSQPAMSPDGKQVAFTVTTVVERENRRHSEVWLAPTAGGASRRLTAPGYESSGPRWSHDGTVLFFTSARPGGTGGTWALRMNVPGEAVQLENWPVGSVPKDGRFAVFAAAPGDTGAAAGGGRGGAAGSGGRGSALSRPPYDAITSALDPARFDGMHITAQRYKANGAGFLPSPASAPVRPRPQQIFTQAFDSTARRQLTSTDYSHRLVTVSPDGRWIAFIADARLRPDSVVRAEADSLAMLPFDPVRDQAPRNDADIFIIPIEGGTPRRVAEMLGTETAVKWSPDNKRLAFLGTPSRTSSVRLWVIDVAGGAPRNLVGTWRYEPADFEWITNDELVLGAEIGGRTALHSVSLKNGQMKEVVGGRRRLSGFSWDEGRRTVAYVSTSLESPTELYMADRDGRNERRITTFNEALSREIAFSSGERFTFQSVGGLEVEGWVMHPYGYDASKKYPLVLYIHGGPHAAYGENWFDEFQNLAGAGFLVLFTNPRGSSGYGADFTFATRGRWFAEDYEDLMKAVDIAAQRPDVDSTRMGVTGGSYGGVMTAWVTVKTDRFKAAQADRMISNWWSWYGTSDAQGLTEFEFFGRPWDNPVMYDTLSPIRYAPRVKTPTFILQSEEDHRTPMTDAEQWFVALRKHGVPAEFVRYPRSTHDLSRTGEPWLLVDRLHRLRVWFTHWLKPDPIPNARAKSITGH